MGSSSAQQGALNTTKDSRKIRAGSNTVLVDITKDKKSQPEVEFSILERGLVTVWRP